MRIESGVSPQRRNRLLFWLVGLAGLAGWFAYDGWINWPAANVEERQKSLPASVAGSPQIDERVIEDLNNKPADDARKVLGSVSPLDLGDQLRYDGPTGYLLIPKKPGERAQWKPLRKSASELWQQKFFACAMGALALLVGLNLIRAMRSRVWLDDAGLHDHRGRFIAWNRMTRLAADELATKNWIELEYDDGGRPARYRLDAHDLAEFEAIVDGICEKREWPNPLGPAEPPPQPAQT